MHSIRKDIHKNRLYLSISGVISISEANKIKDEVIAETSELKPGFDVINNLSKYIKGDERAAPMLQAVEKFFIENKVNRIVRVVGTSKTGLMQFAKYSQPKENVNILYFPTMHEAETFLNKDLKRLHK